MASPTSNVRCLLTTMLVGVTLMAGCRRSAEPEAADSDEISSREIPKESQHEGSSAVEPVAVDREATIRLADEFIGRNDYPAAMDQLSGLLIADPEDFEIVFRLATVHELSGDVEGAIDLLGSIPESDPEAGIAALGQAADWCMKYERYSGAEQRYQTILTHLPATALAHRNLAYLFNRQGRRHEAANHVRELCRLGDVRQDELHALINLSNAMFDDPEAIQNGDSSDRPYWPIGNWGWARKRFTEGNYGEAVKLLRPSLEDDTAPPSIVAFFGRAAAEAQDDKSFQWWLSKADRQTARFSEYWSAIGTVLLTQRKFGEATRALAEAIDRDSTDLMSMSRMRQALGTLEHSESAQRWFDRWTDTKSLLETNNRVAAKKPPSIEAISELVEQLAKLDRNLESVMWKSLRAHYQGTLAQQLSQLQKEQLSILNSKTGFPVRAQRLCNLDVDSFPFPSAEMLLPQENVPTHGEPTKNVVAKFVDVSSELGLSHTYRVASQPTEKHHSIYQTLGGGVVVLDYDLDGWPDLYLAQGGSDPPDFIGSVSNTLYRQRDGIFVEQTAQSLATERQYSIGITSGDWNQDGFADLAVSNIGTTTLLINNGDGTFAHQSMSENANKQVVPASQAMADVNGDALPDLIQVNYVDDENMATKPPIDEQGRVEFTIAPGSFTAGVDQLFVNDGRGGHSLAHIDSQANARTGLGVVITDIDATPGNEVFVGNDSKPNRLWKSDRETGALLDVASGLGCAYGFTGGETGSMGISVADFDRNGELDIYIANYENEDANLYMQRNKSFQDRCIRYELDEDSQILVGFGAQAIDFDNDTWHDLIVTNGHLDDALSVRGGFRQPIQLFQNQVDRFQLMDIDAPFWKTRHVGRGLALVDVDRDGRRDVVVTHVEEPTAILHNQTNTNHHWVQLRLVGTESERDAVGAKVRIGLGDRELFQWVTAGDGYLSRNENVLLIGLGDRSQMDQLSIEWPSGRRQSFSSVAADHRFMIIEGLEELFTLH